MYNPFQLTSTLASNATADEDDTVAAKQAFGQLGYYQTPSYGLTPYPDQGLFDGIKKFQKDNDLTVDGVMQPAGETATALGGILSGLGEAKTPKPAARKAQPVDELGFPLAPSLLGKPATLVAEQKPKPVPTDGSSTVLVPKTPATAPPPCSSRWRKCCARR